MGLLREWKVIKWLFVLNGLEPVDVSHTVRSGRLFKTKGAVGIGFA